MTVYRVMVLWKSGRFLFKRKYTRRAIICIFLFVFLSSLPVFYSSHVVQCYVSFCYWADRSVNYTAVALNKFSTLDYAYVDGRIYSKTTITFCGLQLNTDNPGILLASYWIFGVFFKLLPSFLMLISSLFLITLIHVIENRRKEILGRKSSQRSCSFVGNTLQVPATATCSLHNCPCQSSAANGDRLVQVVTEGEECCCETSQSHSQLPIVLINSTPRRKKRKRVRPRTTRMLISVALICVVVEVPHLRLLNLFVAQHGTWFVESVHNHVIQFIEMLTLLYSSINFVLFCVMNPDFRQTLRFSYEQRRNSCLFPQDHDDLVYPTYNTTRSGKKS